MVCVVCVGPNMYMWQNVGSHANSYQSALKIMLGNEKDYAPSRAAFMYDLKGPALDIQVTYTISIIQ